MDIYVGTASMDTVNGFEHLVYDQYRDSIRWRVQNYLNDELCLRGEITFGDARRAFSFSENTANSDKVIVAKAKNKDDFIDIDFTNFRYCPHCGMLESFDIVMKHDE